MKTFHFLLVLLTAITLSSNAMAMGKRKPQKPVWPPHELNFVVDSQEWLQVSQAFTTQTANIKLKEGQSLGLPFDGPFAVRNWDSNASVTSSYGLLAIDPSDKPVCRWLTIPRDLKAVGHLLLTEVPCDEARSQIYNAQVPTAGYEEALEDQVSFLARVLEEHGKLDRWWGTKRSFDVKIEEAPSSIKFEHRIGFSLTERGTRFSIGTALQTGGISGLHYSAPARAIRNLRLRHLPDGKVQYFFWIEWPNRDVNSPIGFTRQEIELLNPEMFSAAKSEDVLALDNDGNCLIARSGGNLLYCGSRPGKPQVWNFNFRWLTLTIDPRDPDEAIDLTFGQTWNVSEDPADKAIGLAPELTFHLSARR